jgi:hypothetical protein
MDQVTHKSTAQAKYGVLNVTAGGTAASNGLYRVHELFHASNTAHCCHKQITFQSSFKCLTLQWRCILNFNHQGSTQGGRGLQSCTPPPQNRNLKNIFCRYYDIKVLRDFPFSRNQPLKSPDDRYNTILKNKLIKFKKKKQEDRTL